ncbi:beta-galactosidase [Saccharicrinis aurantiacus]|uniref:beta-galactosidase n=1 Tax=Saccharicrinis aurantiacus TaxID=1849719 RepID=UPI0015C53113|nr:beta-galactosidase [Saccharicrinis aurantiacus]
MMIKYQGNKIQRQIVMLLIFFASLITAKAQTEQEVNAKISTLNSLIQDAQAIGLDVTKEQMTVQTAEIYLGYAQWDEDNVDKNESYYLDHPYYNNDAKNMAQQLPSFIREGIIEILDQSIVTLTDVIAGDIKRRDVSNFNWADVELVDNHLEVNGEPVFLADYNWRPNEDRYTAYYGQFDGSYISPNYIINEQGDPNTYQYNSIVAKPNTSFGDVFLDNNIVPQWAKNKYPDITVGSRKYGKYDIDHPGSREMYQLLFEKFIPLMAGKKYRDLGYMLFNEPSFYTVKDSWNSTDDNGVCVSDYTIEKYKLWLSNKHGDITTLNNLWDKSFASFEELTTTLPMPKSMQGTAEWYDWMSFNMYRVTEWFKFIKAEIKKYDSDAKVHMKLMPHCWSENKHDHGMDFEALTEISDIIGCDAGAAYLYAWGEDKEILHDYAVDWREAFMTFDFFKSVKPNQVIYDSENHFLAKTAFAEYDLNQDYVRSMYWLAFMHGLNASQAWVWSRENGNAINESRGYNGSLIVGVSHQPKTLHTITSTFMDANSFGKELTDMNSMDKPIRVFFSQTSAHLDDVYMDKVFKTYESMFFEGVPIGFATQNILNNQTPNWEVVVINNTEFVTNSEFDAIQNYLNNGGAVILANGSLLKDEYGRDHGSLSAGTGSLYKLSSVEDIKEKALELVESAGKMPDIQLTQSSEGVKGCVWRIVDGENGNKVLSVVNLGKEDNTVKVTLNNPQNGTKCVDLFTGKEVSPKVTLKPFEVYFVEISDEESNVSVPSIGGDKDFNFSSIYPNPSGGRINIYFTSIVPDTVIEVKNMAGVTIIKKNVSAVSEATVDISTVSRGTYLVSILSGNKHQVHKYIKI